jgi:hypothetical protein
MSKRNTPEPGGTPRQVRPPSADRSLWIVPRRWLLALPALIVLPWLIAVAFFSGGLQGTAGVVETAAEPAAADPPGTPLGAPQPWGQLTVTPIVISPPLEYVPTNWGPVERPQWFFPGASPSQVEQFLTAAGLPAMQASQLAAGFRPHAGGTVALPDPAFVKGLERETRGNIYQALASSAVNDRHRNAYRYFGTADQWFRGAPISAETRALVDPYIYRLGEFSYFADIDLVRPAIADPAELQRLAKALSREATMIVRLRIDTPAQLAAAVEYWGRGGRRTDIRPLLESITSSGQDPSIDISHLLPSLGREYLYRYPRITLADLQKPSLVNCFWTALNFFNVRPDDRYLDPAYALDRLKSEYFIVHDQLQFGDVAAFTDPEGNIFHAAVYLADGLVFGKNGTSHLSPWSIVPIERLKGYYVEHIPHWQVTYYRRKEL